VISIKREVASVENCRDVAMEALDSSGGTNSDGGSTKDVVGAESQKSQSASTNHN
jgi:hypothetical protein